MMLSRGVWSGGALSSGTVRGERGYRRESSGLDRSLLFADRCLALTLEDEQDFFRAVGVAAEMLAGLQLEIDDSRALCAGTRRDRETCAHAG